MSNIIGMTAIHIPMSVIHNLEPDKMIEQDDAPGLSPNFSTIMPADLLPIRLR